MPVIVIDKTSLEAINGPLRVPIVPAGIDEVTLQQQSQARKAINLGIPPIKPEILPLYRGLLEIRNLYEPPTVGYPTLLSRPSALHGRNYQEQVKILRNRTIA